MPTPAKVTLWRHDTHPIEPTEPRYGLQSPYVERFYLPVMGPTAIALFRMVDRRLPTTGASTTVELADLAQALGVDRDVTVHRTLVRMSRYNLLSDWEGESFGFPMDLPQLSRIQFNRLPDPMKLEHGLYVALGEQRDLSDAAFERFRELEDEEGR